MIWRGNQPRCRQPHALYYFVRLTPDQREQIDQIVRRAPVLYIGETSNLPARIKEHNGSGLGDEGEPLGKWGWWPQIGVVLVDHFPPGTTTAQARAAEMRAIKNPSRRPLFNWKGNERYFARRQYKEAIDDYNANYGTGRSRPVSRFGLFVKQLIARVKSVLIGAIALIVVCLIVWAVTATNVVETIHKLTK